MKEALPYLPLCLLLSGAAHASEDWDGQRFYAGDLHVHTGVSPDGGSADLGNCSGSCGDFSAVFDTARANGLDFVALTDHINAGPAAFEDWDIALGFVGGTDGHDTRPGEVCAPEGHMLFGGGTGYAGSLTMLALDDSEPFTRGAIYDALVARRSYVTTGPPAPVRVAYRMGGDWLGEMGDAIDLPEGEDLTVEAALPPGWAIYALDASAVTADGEIPLFDQGGGIWAASIPAIEVPEWLYVQIRLDGASYYAGTDCEDGGDDDDEHLWISPSWITLTDPLPDDDLDGDGYTTGAGDCDDGDAAIFPGAEELCDGLDQDCDLTADEGASDAGAWFADADADADGDPGSLAMACDAPADHVADDADCDDGDPGVHPGADELCDGLDQDCDLLADEAAIDPATWHLDADGDGYGDPAATDQACDAPADHVADAGDCDDADAGVSSGAEEIPGDGIDQDCDGEDLPGEAPPTCGELVTRERSFWSANVCVIHGAATPDPLLPITVGGVTYSTWQATRGGLTGFGGGPVARLGRELLAARLNEAAFGLAGLDWALVGAGIYSGTIEEVLDHADTLYAGGSASSEVTAMLSAIAALNAAGAGEPLWFDPSCELPPETCDGADEDGDGAVDEACGCP